MFSVAPNVAPPSQQQDCDSDAVREGRRGGHQPHLEQEGDEDDEGGEGGAGDGERGGYQPAEEGEPQGAAAGVGRSPLLAQGLASRSAVS